MFGWDLLVPQDEPDCGRLDRLQHDWPASVCDPRVAGPQDDVVIGRCGRQPQAAVEDDERVDAIAGVDALEPRGGEVESHEDDRGPSSSA